MEAILKELTYKFGASGSEDEVRDYIKRKVEGKFKIREDLMGNLEVYLREDSKFVFLTPIDEASFFISGEEGGRFKFKILGNYNPADVIDRVVVSRDGKIGIIRNVENKEKPEISDLRIEMLDKEKPGIGEPFIIQPYFLEKKDFIISTNFNARAGAAVFLNLLERDEFSPAAKFVFLSQTKMRNRSLYPLMRKQHADFYFLIGTAPCKEGIELGKGPVMTLIAKDYVLPLEWRKRITRILEEENIPFQIQVEDSFSYLPFYMEPFGLKKFIFFSIPLKYHNSVYKLSHKKDYIVLKELFEKLIKRL